MSQRSLYKKYNRDFTAWDLNCKCVDNSTRSRRKLKKKISKLTRKRIDKIILE